MSHQPKWLDMLTTNNARRISTIFVFIGISLLPAPASRATDPPSFQGQLLYSRLTNGTWQIWRKDLATGERTQITSSPGDKRYPAWSREEDTLYQTSNQACYRVGKKSRSEEPFLADLWPIRDLALSPDGTKLAFSKLRNDLVDSADLWVADASGAKRRMITQEPGLQSHSAWSSDGARIAYVHSQGYKSAEICSINADGTGRARLTNNQARDLLPAWSPDGEWIAFSSDASGDSEIWVMQADGKEPKQLTHSPGLDSRPAWSPDGEWIAFATNRSGTLEIWVMRKDGTSQQLLEQVEGGACDPAWR